MLEEDADFLHRPQLALKGSKGKGSTVFVAPVFQQLALQFPSSRSFFWSVTGIATAEQLEDLLSTPDPKTIEAMRRLEGDLLVLGIAGKMGPSLARMARRASDLAGRPRRVIGVARFSSPQIEAELQRHGIETVKCDLLDPDAVQRLPDAPNVLFLAGMKFGATGQESLTWAMNVFVPALVARKFHRSRLIALSTGNIYGLVPREGQGSAETDAACPVGEYAVSCLGRERMFEHFSRTQLTPMALVRLNYACDLRYGVLVDLAQKIIAGRPVDLGMSWFNTIWQADVNIMTLCCFDHVASPPFILNLTGPEQLNVREVCKELGRLLGKEPVFCGTEAPTALLSNAARAFQLFGKPSLSAEMLIRWVADWIGRRMPTLNKPTHFESRDGKF